MNEQLVPFGARFNFYFYNYWTLSYIMCLKSILGYLGTKKNTLMEEQTIGTFWDLVQFFFRSPHLRLFKFKCNLTNKKPWPNVSTKFGRKGSIPN